MKLYNTLTRKIEEVKPINPPNIFLYTCGPTVYDYTHIGHMRAFVVNDLLKRVLDYNGFKVKRVMNITDVGHLTGDDDTGSDKLEKGAKKSNKTVWEVAKFFTDYFFETTDALNILRPDITCKATDHIPEMIEIIKKLFVKGLAYETKEAVYFNIEKFPNYGNLSGQKISEKLKGVREDIFVDPENIISENEIALVLEAAKNEGFITEYFIQTNIVEDKNWNEEYEKNVKVIEVSERLVIKPSFKEYNTKGNQIVITIDPKMSFGTGEHETTKLILTILEKYISPGDFVLDVGSGTGILAIASVLLGGKKAIGIDNDEWCLLNGNENVKLNSLEEKVEIRLGEISQIEEKNFDLILANINKHILLEVATHIKSKIKKTGKLILSGLLESDADEILSIYSLSQFEMIEKKQFGDWIAIVFKVSNSH